MSFHFYLLKFQDFLHEKLDVIRQNDSSLISHEKKMIGDVINKLKEGKTSITTDQEQDINRSAGSSTSECDGLSFDIFKRVLLIKDPSTNRSLFHSVMKKMEFCRFDPAFASLEPPNDLSDKSVGDLIHEMFQTADSEV